MRYLVRQLKGTRAAAELLEVSQRTVERYVKKQIRTPRPQRAARLETEVRRRRQPQVRARARQRAGTTDGIVVDTRTRIGYTARLFDAQQQGADERRLMEITAEGLKEVYFQDADRRAGSLEEVRFTDVEHVGFEL
ncbi:XRE family transcriptional regulator [Streptomyces mutabilis]|nr:XRE family transcriptional regulator [Streptomyces mutabilis]MCZ9349210.1 XRE family transcriptional regulator [Streptomyces mutabilis]MCZ9353778.1 XRE family transcriptional regulator [Streptomyces mutabilis]